MIISRKKKVARPATETEEAETKGKTRHLEKARSIIKEDARTERDCTDVNDALGASRLLASSL